MLLTQCYTPYEYLTKDYDVVDEKDRIEKILLSDSTQYEIGRRDFYKIESDSILILVNQESVNQNGNISYSETRDTINVSEVHSYSKSELNIPLSIVTGAVVGIGSLYLFAYLIFASSGVFGD